MHLRHGGHFSATMLGYCCRVDSTFKNMVGMEDTFLQLCLVSFLAINFLLKINLASLIEVISI
jgi:hypothetical protein